MFLKLSGGRRICRIKFLEFCIKKFLAWIFVQKLDSLLMNKKMSYLYQLSIDA